MFFTRLFHPLPGVRHPGWSWLPVMASQSLGDIDLDCATTSQARRHSMGVTSNITAMSEVYHFFHTNHTITIYHMWSIWFMWLIGLLNRCSHWKSLLSTKLAVVHPWTNEDHPGHYSGARGADRKSTPKTSKTSTDGQKVVQFWFQMVSPKHHVSQFLHLDPEFSHQIRISRGHLLICVDPRPSPARRLQSTLLRDALDSTSPARRWCANMGLT